MTGDEAKARFDAAAKAVKKGDPRADELIALCFHSDQDVLRERLKNRCAKTTEEFLTNFS